MKIQIKQIAGIIFTAFIFLLLSGSETFGETAQINGAKIYYEDAGKGEAVVLIHGGLADSRVWDEQFAKFAKHFRVIRYDLRGYGKSEFPTEEFSHVEDLSALLKFLKIEKCSLVGLSIGGVIAADFTLAHPETVDKLILTSAGLRGDSSPTDEKTIEVYKAAQAGEKEKAIDLWFANSLFSTIKSDSPNGRKTRLMLADNYRYWGVREKPAAQWAKQPTSERLAEIKSRTLVIAGDKDAAAIRTIADTLHNKISGSQKILVKNASHHLNLEQPKEYNRIVIDFLKKGK